MSDATATSATEGAPGRDRWLQKGSVDPAASVPVLVDALGNAAQHWSESFCGLAATDGEFAFEGLGSARVIDLPGRRDGSPIFASLRIPAWDAIGCLMLDRAAVATVVEAFFGGGGEEDTVIADRALSPVEARIVDVLGGQAAVALTAALRDITPAKVEYGAMQTKPDANFLGKPATTMLIATFALKAVRRTVEFDIILPQDAIDARATLWSREGSGAPALDPAGWSRQLRTEVSRTAVALQASIVLQPMTLGALANLRVGQTLELPPDARSKVLLRCGHERLFGCELGQSGGFYTMRIEEALEPDPQSPGKGR